jgi:hypothetical protein
LTLSEPSPSLISSNDPDDSSGQSRIPQSKGKFSGVIKNLLVVLLLSVSWVVAQEPSAKPNTYDALLERAKKKDETVDFKELRFAYTDTDKYSPYGGDRDAKRNLFAALDAKDYEKALAHAGKMLDANYVDITGHFGSYVAHRELDHTEQAEFHRFMTTHLLDSLKKSGDGKTTATAIPVISTDEEYVLFDFLGLRPQSQALVHQEGHSYDKMTALDPKTNQTVIYYFNIDKPFGWLEKSLKKQ